MRALNHEQARYYLDIGREQLADPDQTRLDSHLADCAACRRYAEDSAAFQGRLVEMMHARWDGYSPDPAVKVRVQARLRQRIRPKQWFNFAASAAASAILVGMVVLLSWLAWQTRPLPTAPATPALAPTTVPQLPVPASGDWPVLPGLATFGDTVKLLGFNLARDSLNPDDMAEITLYWQLRPNTATYSVFLHLLDADQQIWSQVDRPLSEECQTTQGEFTPGLWAGCYALPVTAPPGTYQLAVGIYDAADGQRLTTETGQVELALTTIQVGTSPIESPPPSPAPTAAPTPTPFPTSARRTSVNSAELTLVVFLTKVDRLE